MDPAALVEVINEAQAAREAARAELAKVKTSGKLDAAEVYAMIDSLGDIGATLEDAKPERLAQLYAKLQVELLYEHTKKAVVVTAPPRVVNVCVREVYPNAQLWGIPHSPRRGNGS